MPSDSFARYYAGTMYALSRAEVTTATERSIRSSKRRDRGHQSTFWGPAASEVRNELRNIEMLVIDFLTLSHGNGDPRRSRRHRDA